MDIDRDSRIRRVSDPQVSPSQSDCLPRGACNLEEPVVGPGMSQTLNADIPADRGRTLPFLRNRFPIFRPIKQSRYRNNRDHAAARFDSGGR